MNKRYLILDYETRSRADLGSVGGFEYAVDPSTRVLCVSWRLGTREELAAQLKAGTPAPCWSPAFTDTSYGELKRALLDESVMLVAHNALFEQLITRYVLTKEIHDERLKTIPISRWVCTASLAAAMALPKKLEHACKALELTQQKDMEGHRLMLKLSKPRRVSKLDKRPWHNKASELRRLMQYCAADIDAETALFLRLPLLSPNERKIWELDQKINLRGFYVDRPLVEKILRLIDLEMQSVKERVTELTDGQITSTGQVSLIQKWLSVRGCHLPDLRAQTLRDALGADLAQGDAKTMLLLRQMSAKSSTKKYQAFNDRSRNDSRLRDILSYHRAHHGRWGGVGVQPQNFPRPTVKGIEDAIELIKGIADDREALEAVRLLYGNPMEVFASMLRSVIIAPPGSKLFCADFASIEVRVLFWFAEHFKGLSAFENDEPMYEQMASVIYGLAMEAVFKESRERQVGKTAVLGMGYMMGWAKFIRTCKDQANIVITEEEAKKAVRAYRTLHAPVVDLWYALENAAIEAVKTGERVSTHNTTWYVEGKFLFCELPSGRRNAYYGPKVKSELTPWEDKRDVLYHWRCESQTGRWIFEGTYGGALTEHVVSGTARDLMAEAMLREEAAGYPLVLTVHDELLADRKSGGSVAEFEELMAKLPPWAAGIPVKTVGYEATRYRK